jgi:hypothetical protein
MEGLCNQLTIKTRGKTLSCAIKPFTMSFDTTARKVVDILVSDRKLIVLINCGKIVVTFVI